MKKLTVSAEFSSIFNDPKWVVQLQVHGFSSRNPKENRDLIVGVRKLVDEYNGRRLQRSQRP